MNQEMGLSRRCCEAINMKDWKHFQMQKDIIKIFEKWGDVELEVPYNHFGERGFVDVYILPDSKSNCVLMEIKTKIDDFGATLRQYKKMVQYVPKAWNMPYQVKIRTKCWLILPFQKEIYNFILKNLNTFTNVNIRFLGYSKGEMRWEKPKGTATFVDIFQPSQEGYLMDKDHKNESFEERITWQEPYYFHKGVGD